MKKNRKTAIMLCILLFVSGTPYRMIEYTVKHQRIYVENEETTLYDLCYPYHRENFIHNQYKTLSGIFTNNMVGLGIEDTRKFGGNEVRPLLHLDLYRFDMAHINLCSGIKPILNEIELYELENEYYLKVHYILNRDYNGYSAVYKFEVLEEEYVENALCYAAIRKGEDV